MLHPKTSVKYFGISLDESLSCTTHVKQIKITAFVYFRYYTQNSQRCVVTINVLRIIYYWFVHTDLQYCTVSSGTAYDSVLQRLSTMHDNVLRALRVSHVECHI